MKDIWYYINQLIMPAIVTFGLWWIKRGIDSMAKKQEQARIAEMARQEQQDAEKQELMYQMMQGITATRSLSKATAVAFKNGHCNGEIDRALKESDRVDKEQAALLQKIGVKNFF